MKKDVCVVIPARYRSSRYPGKPLVLLLGKPMIIWVCELSSKAIGATNVFVATDDEGIRHVVESHGYQAIMTSERALTGTDRIAEASELLEYDIIINVQGDEPMVNPTDIIRAIDLKKRNPDKIINCFCKLNEDCNVESKNIPKLVTTERNELLYISRSVIPGCKSDELRSRHWKKQVCIYAFNKEELRKFKEFGRKSKLEEQEDIEILRFFELDIKILMLECESSSQAVDCPEDVFKVEKELIKQL